MHFERVMVLMHEKSQAAQKSKSRKVVLPFGVPKPWSRDEKKMLEQVAEPFGEDAVWLTKEGEVLVSWERVFTGPLPFESIGNLECPDKVGLHPCRYHACMEYEEECEIP